MLSGNLSVANRYLPIRSHLLAAGVGRGSVASSCRTFAKPCDLFYFCACLLVMQTRSRSKSPDFRSSATPKAKKATATPAPAAKDAADQLPPQSLAAPSASTAAGLTDSLANQRMDTLAARRDRTWRSATGAMAASSRWGAGRWRARLGSDVSVSTNKYRAVSALAMLGVERAWYAWR